MSDNWLESKPNCYIEFRVYDRERFELMQRFFDTLRDWTRDLGGEPQRAGESVGTLAVDDTQESRQVNISAAEETHERRNFSKPAEWLLAFTPDDLEALGMPPHREAIKALQSWQGLSRRERRKETRGNRELQTLADFTSMIRHWQDVEYELISCEMTESDRGRIEYSTFNFPYKGKVALEELLLFFGFFSIIHESC
jgi:hypothetical protein